MPITAATIKVGEAIWRAVAPWKRLKIARNKRRARLGKPLLPLTEDDDKMLPKGTMTYAGIAATAVGFGLRLFGIGECSVEEMATAAQACVDPNVVDRLVQGANEALEAGGLLIAAIGRRRAAKNAVAELAAAQAKPGV